jgi:hypothetical protein
MLISNLSSSNNNKPNSQRKSDKHDNLIQTEQTTIQEKPEDDLITSKEACKILKCSFVSLWRYEKKGRIQAYGIVGKKYFKRSEILQSIVKK